MRIIDVIADFLNGLGIVLVRSSIWLVDIVLQANLMALPLIIGIPLADRFEGDIGALITIGSFCLQAIWVFAFWDSIITKSILNVSKSMFYDTFNLGYIVDRILHTLKIMFFDNIKAAFNLLVKIAKSLIEIGKENKL